MDKLFSDYIVADSPGVVQEAVKHNLPKTNLLVDDSYLRARLEMTVNSIAQKTLVTKSGITVLTR